MESYKHPRQFLPLLAIGTLFLLQWLFLFNPNPGVWDGAFYYAYARSPVFDQDLDLVNDFELSYPYGSPDFVTKALENNLTETGRVASPFAIGSPALWIPWLTVARIAQPSAAITGYEWGFVGPTAVFSSLLALFAFWLAYRLAHAETSQSAALLAALTFMLATPLIYYQFREPFYSHATSVFANTLCIFVWWKEWGRQGKWPQALKLGAFIGFAALVRWQYLIYLLLPAYSALIWLWQSADWKKSFWRITKHMIIVGVAAFIIISPQLAIWQVFYGSWLTVPQGAAYVDWSAPNIYPTLFSPFRGLLAWMPIILPTIIGLLLLLRRRPHLTIPLILLFLLEIYVNGSTADWFGGGGYGPRRFTGELAVFVLGYATFLAALAPRLRWAAGIVGGLLFGGHQLLLLRYGLAEKLGGQVLSMYPSYEWFEVSWSEFLASLWQKVPTAVSQPMSFLTYGQSPLDYLWRHGQFPWVHLGSLLLTAVYLLLLAFFWQQIKKRTTSKQIVIAAFSIIMLTNIWILVGS